MSSILNSVYFFWAVLAIPSIPLVFRVLNGGDFGELLHPTGEFSVRFMIVALMLTPLTMLLPRLRLIPLALSSNSYMVKKLKKKWKPLQRCVYAAAVLTLIHWIFIQSRGPALLHFAPLALLEIYRIYRIKIARG